MLVKFQQFLDWQLPWPPRVGQSGGGFVVKDRYEQPITPGDWVMIISNDDTTLADVVRITPDAMSLIAPMFDPVTGAWLALASYTSAPASGE